MVGMNRRLNRRRFLKLCTAGLAGVAMGGTDAFFRAGNQREALAAGCIPAPQDALQNRTTKVLENFGSWCQEHSVGGYVGEFQAPNANKRAHVEADQAKWLTLLDIWYAQANCFGLWATMWNASVLNYAQGTANWLNAYTPPQDGSGSKTLSKSYPQAQICEKAEYQSAGTIMRGVNIAGGENENAGFNNQNRGVYDVDYRYPSAESYAFLAGKGHKLVRLPFRWERVQPVLGAGLDQTELGRIRSSIDGARRAGMRVILDCHNYARYKTPSGEHVIGESTTVTMPHFSNLWGRLSANFAQDATVVGYGLMNEPHTMKSRDGLTPAQAWEDVSRRALTAIRNNGDAKLVLVSGYNWSSARRWREFHPRPWIQDASVRYEAHHYFDTANSGWYERTYDEEVVSAQSEGY